jgi:hypothetical protein
MKRAIKCFTRDCFFQEFFGATLSSVANQIAWTLVSCVREQRAGKSKGMNQELLITCIEVRRELSNYMDEEVTPELRSRIEEHVSTCSGCKAIYDGLRNVLTLVTATELIELPRGFSARLYRRLRQAETN